MSAETVKALAAALDISVEELTTGDQAYPSVTPFVFYAEPGSFEWLVSAFGFQERMKVPGPGGIVVHGELAHGNGIIMVGPTSDGQAAKTPKQSGVHTQSLYLMVDDARAHCETARAAGAKIVSEPAEAHGHVRYTAEDPEGHHWMFASELG